MFSVRFTLHMVAQNLETISGDTGHKAEDTLDKMPNNRRGQTHATDNLEMPIRL